MKLTPYSHSSLVNTLQENKLLRGLSQEKFSLISNQVELEIWPKHTCRIDRMKPMQKFYFVLSGRIKVYKVNADSGRELTLFILTKRDAFDLLCLLEEKEHEVFYETLDKVVLFSVPMENMRQWLQEFPEINRNMLPYLGHSLKAMENYASDITMIDISTRLARLILSNINSTSQKLELINDLSNEELANLIGTTRAVINRHLQEFKNEGILYLGRQKLEIRNLQRLLELAKSRPMR